VELREVGVLVPANLDGEVRRGARGQRRERGGDREPRERAGV
jgi:hypothetical protein